MTRLLWLLCGSVSLFIGMAGIILPLVPTVPLLLLAAFCFARSSKQLHRWLIDHPKLGLHIRDWQERGSIRRKAKLLASTSICGAFCISVLLELPLWALILQGFVLASVATFIWTRPEE